MEETKPNASLFYPNISSLSEQDINDKILANDKFNNNINIIKDIKSYNETETESIAEITERTLSSTATTVAVTGNCVPFSVPTSFATVTIYGSLSNILILK